jgi:hypothetical protein
MLLAGSPGDGGSHQVPPALRAPATFTGDDRVLPASSRHCIIHQTFPLTASVSSQSTGALAHPSGCRWSVDMPSTICTAPVLSTLLRRCRSSARNTAVRLPRKKQALLAMDYIRLRRDRSSRGGSTSDSHPTSSAARCRHATAAAAATAAAPVQRQFVVSTLSASRTLSGAATSSRTQPAG